MTRVERQPRVSDLDELREFFSLHDGQDVWVGDRLAGTLLLDTELLSLDGMQE